MGYFSVCKKDHLIKEMRQTFGATPLKIPESTFNPLYVFGWDGRSTTDKKGDLSHLLIGETKLNIATSTSKLANLSSKKSRLMNTRLGLELLGGFIQALGFKLNPFSFAFDGVKQVSFSFSDVQRKYIDKNELGKEIAKFTIDVSNPNMSDFRSGKLKFMLIDSVIVSPSFTIHSEKTATADFSINVAAINEAIGKAEVKAKVEVRGQKDLSFEGEGPLAFAITSMPVDIDWKTGKIIGFGSIEGPDSLGEAAEHPIIGLDGQMLQWD